MERIMTDMTTSISEFKANPSREVAKAGDKPFAVLTNNRPSFYVLSAKAFDEMMEQIWQQKITPIILERLRDDEPTVRVKLEDL